MTEEKKGPGRPEHVPDDVSRGVVAALTAHGIPMETIAAYIGIHDDTLRKHYLELIEEVRIDRKARVENFLFYAASGQAFYDGKASLRDCAPSAMFYAKTQLGYREKSAIDVTSGGERIGANRELTPEEVEQEMKKRGIPTPDNY